MAAAPLTLELPFAEIPAVRLEQLPAAEVLALFRMVGRNEATVESVRELIEVPEEYRQWLLHGEMPPVQWWCSRKLPKCWRSSNRRYQAALRKYLTFRAEYPDRPATNYLLSQPSPLAVTA